MELQLDSAHESLVTSILAKLDLKSKCALMCTCRFLLALCSRHEHWKSLVFCTANEQQGLGACHLLNVLQRSHGACEVIRLARSAAARQAEGQQRFSNGYKYDQVLPHTQGLRAYALAAMCPILKVLSIDERASCVGGMTNDMARALATHCKQLEVLEVFFQRYSLPSELFTDEGLIALSEGCRKLQKITLHNCDRISDRSMYALAANCPSLTAVSIGGYNEHVTDGGMTVLFEACQQLHSVRLSSKLLKVTDTSGVSLARNCRGLVSITLTATMGNATVNQLAASCKQVQEVDLHGARSVTCDALQQLVASCPALNKIVLPQQLQLDCVVQQLPRCSLQVVVGPELQVLGLQH